MSYYHNPTQPQEAGSWVTLWVPLFYFVCLFLFSLNSFFLYSLRFPCIFILVVLFLKIDQNALNYIILKLCICGICMYQGQQQQQKVTRKANQTQIKSRETFLSLRKRWNLWKWSSWLGSCVYNNNNSNKNSYNNRKRWNLWKRSSWLGTCVYNNNNNSNKNSYNNRNIEQQKYCDASSWNRSWISFVVVVTLAMLV